MDELINLLDSSSIKEAPWNGFYIDKCYEKNQDKIEDQKNLHFYILKIWYERIKKYNLLEEMSKSIINPANDNMIWIEFTQEERKKAHSILFHSSNS